MQFRKVHFLQRKLLQKGQHVFVSKVEEKFVLLQIYELIYEIYEQIYELRLVNVN